ncbi:MAG: hypothetical protein AB1651_17565 [Pseudomonadota bacterium]
MKTRPVLELLLLIGLPAAVLLAGVLTTALAYQHGFTPVPGAERIVGTR